MPKRRQETPSFPPLKSLERGYKQTLTNPPCWTMRTRTTFGSQHGAKPMSNTLSGDIKSAVDASRYVPPKFSIYGRLDDVATKELRPGPGQYFNLEQSTVLMKDPLIKCPGTTRFGQLPRDTGSSALARAHSTPGPGTYIYSNDIYLKKAPVWSMKGRGYDMKSQSANVIAYDVDKLTRKGPITPNKWTMLPRREFDPARGLGKSQAPGPCSYKYGVYADGYINRPPRWSFGTNPRFDY